MISQTYVIGVLAKDPRLGTTRHSARVANFSIAVPDEWRTREGEKREDLVWWRVVAWGKLADFVMSLKAGDVVYAAGTARLDEFEASSGEKKANLELRAKYIKNLRTREEGDS